MSNTDFSWVSRTLAVAATAASVLMFPPVVAGVHAPRAETGGAIEEAHTFAGSYLAGRVAGNMQDSTAAATFYRRALLEDPENPTLLERSLALSLVAGQMDEAMALAERLAGSDAGHPLARLTLGVKALKSRQYAEARQHLEGAGSGPLAELTSALLVAWTESGAGNSQAALDKVGGLAGPDWYEVFKPYHSGLLAEVAGDEAAAGTFFRQAYETDNGALRIVQAWARHLAKAGRSDEALAVLAGFSAVVPDHPLVTTAAAAITAGQVSAPIVSTAQDGAAEVLYGIGSALGSEGGEESAAIYLQLALYLSPGQPLALLSLADYYEKVEDNARAIETYAAVPEGSPLRRNADIHRALNHNDLGQLDKARGILEKLIETDPSELEPITALGNVLRGHEMFEEAADVYSKAIDQIDEPQARHWTLYYFRGICYERAKQWPKAEADLQQALALFPEQPHVLNYLGYSWVDQNINLDEAMEMIQRAVELRPNDGYIVDSLGWAYYRLGRYQAAVRELERAVELKPEDPVINDHLGDAYWKVGRKLEARFQWAHARDLSPEPDVLKEILRKLKTGLVEEKDRAADLRKQVE